MWRRRQYRPEPFYLVSFNSDFSQTATQINHSGIGYGKVYDGEYLDGMGLVNTSRRLAGVTPFENDNSGDYDILADSHSKVHLFSNQSVEGTGTHFSSGKVPWRVLF